jgi:hypothetical protein
VWAGNPKIKVNDEDVRWTKPILELAAETPSAAVGFSLPSLQNFTVEIL